MATNENFQVIFNGKMLNLSMEKMQHKVLSSGISFSGSLEYGENHALLFSLVNKVDMEYIFKELAKIKSEVKLDIRTNDDTTEVL